MMEIFYRRLINWVLLKLSTLIGQQAKVHICDWLKKVKRIYEPSCLLVHGTDLHWFDWCGCCIWLFGWVIHFEKWTNLCLLAISFLDCSQNVKSKNERKYFEFSERKYFEFRKDVMMMQWLIFKWQQRRDLDLQKVCSWRWIHMLPCAMQCWKTFLQQCQMVVTLKS